MDIKEYREKLEELLSKGLYIDEADAVINGSCTLEEALANHKNIELTEDLEGNDVNMDSYEDAEKIMNVVREITAKEAE